MLIPIQSGAANDDDDTPREWSLLELNGELIPPSVGPTESSSGGTVTTTTSGTRMELGSVRFSSDGTPVMTLGSHELKGKVENLKQPFVVLKKKRKREDENGEGGGGGDSPDDMASASLSAASVSYEVAGIVKKKMLFDNYPKSIMR
eukprot:CAMPEP_0197721120 /NCGR_PEP_ID=MMETSP1434-20131217/4275_1 /TAXON_ID=265543 /ORGANISM="Minutocellus polymorphus, Strain CCMP3303" /LENGTH=146 /DNA_ID=CAMNT_0043306079 /DNA_START=42 /DNA_END=482 /DNA_ORIENTATION=-